MMPDRDTPNSDTSRTDAETLKDWQGQGRSSWVSADFARQLERELNEAKQQLTYALDAANKGEEGRKLGTALEECIKERDQLKQCAEQLADRIRIVHGHDLTCSYDSLSSDPATDICNCGKVTDKILKHFNTVKSTIK